MKTYTVWVRVCIEEQDTETGDCRNVALEDGEVVEFTDTYAINETAAFKSESLEEAQEYVDHLAVYI